MLRAKLAWSMYEVGLVSVATGYAGCGETGTDRSLGADERWIGRAKSVGEHCDGVRIAEADEAGTEPRTYRISDRCCGYSWRVPIPAIFATANARCLACAVLAVHCERGNLPTVPGDAR